MNSQCQAPAQSLESIGCKLDAILQWIVAMLFQEKSSGMEVERESIE
jgi:hypothetical protein